jgi:polar amino acid transport system substrate-binding protein
MILGENSGQCIGIVLNYGREGEGGDAIGRRTVNLKTAEFPQGSGQSSINVGLVGVGLHSKGVILPVLGKIKGINLIGVADAQGLKARDAGAKYGFKYATSDYRQILDDKNIDTVIIATPHNLHATMLIEAVEAKKNIFIEKPLALNFAELKEIAKNCKKNPVRLMVGFNRRFSPFSARAKEFLEFYGGPRVIDCRVNVGYIPKNHWVHDPAVGGGNIIGEACHFIDLIQFFSGSRPSEVYARAISGDIDENVAGDNIVAAIKMQNGSVASLVYTALGNRSYSREKIEIFGGEAVIDRGYRGEFTAFFDAIRQGRPSPVQFEDYFYTSLATFKIMESIKRGLPEPISIGDLDI